MIILRFVKKTKKKDGIYDSKPHPGKIIIKTIELRMTVIVNNSNYADKLRANMLKPNWCQFNATCINVAKRIVSGESLEFDLRTQFNSNEFDVPDFLQLSFENIETIIKKKIQVNLVIIKSKTHFRNDRNESFTLESSNLNFAKHKYLKYMRFKPINCGSIKCTVQKNS